MLKNVLEESEAASAPSYKLISVGKCIVIVQDHPLVVHHSVLFVFSFVVQHIVVFVSRDFGGVGDDNNFGRRFVFVFKMTLSFQYGLYTGFDIAPDTLDDLVTVF